MNNEDIITFIIPTIGRLTLKNSIDSLLNQTIKEWKAIIIFDGIHPNIDVDDTRIKIVEINKKGENINNAGLVRNHGISLSNTKWIGFLDDDDILSNDYIEIFNKELLQNITINLDVIIFRMKLNDRIIPKLNCDNFYVCDVGISYILKKEIFDNGIIFQPSGAEDFVHLDEIRKNGYKMMISPYIKYYVRCEEYKEDGILGERVFINISNKFIDVVGYLLLLKFFKE